MPVIALEPGYAGPVQDTEDKFGGNRLLCVYRRKDELGLWAVLARIGVQPRPWSSAPFRERI